MDARGAFDQSFCQSCAWTADDRKLLAQGVFIVRPSRSHGRGTPTPALSTRTARRLRGRSSNRPDGRDADPGEQIQSRRGQSEGRVRARSTHARKRVVWGKGVAVRVHHGGRSIIKKKKQKKK